VALVLRAARLGEALVFAQDLILATIGHALTLCFLLDLGVKVCVESDAVASSCVHGWTAELAVTWLIVSEPTTVSVHVEFEAFAV
jgi:hypothetical protein